MSPTEPDRRKGAKRRSIDRRRFFSRSLAAGASGLLALLGLAGRDGRGDEQTPAGSADCTESSRELAG